MTGWRSKILGGLTIGQAKEVDVQARQAGDQEIARRRQRRLEEEARRDEEQAQWQEERRLAEAKKQKKCRASVAG